MKPINHTAGTWVRSGSYIRVKGDVPGARAIATYHKRGTLREQACNAILIAAAPRMLALLIQLNDAVEALDGTSIENEALVNEYRALMRNLTTE